MRCPHCNSKVTKKNKFCPECGMAIVWEEKEASQTDNSRGIRTLIVIGILLLIAIVAVGVMIAFGGEGGIDNSISSEETMIVEAFTNNPEAISLASQSVVKLNCYDENGDLYATGSGFAAFEEGVIITNYHVIEDYPSRIEIETETGQTCDIFGGIGVAKERDIAILYYQQRSTNIDLPILATGSSEHLKKGEKVIAIGSPLGLTNVVSSGIFSTYAQNGNATDIQFTASISSGSSGGALFNDNGEVIGITYASLESGQNLNFAVPIEFVNALWKSESADRSELTSFYDTIIPHYSISYVVSNYKELENSIFYLDCKVANYESSEQGIVAYCTDNGTNTIKAIYNHWNDYFANKMINLMVSGGNGVKCVGVKWSESDNAPYVILGI